jgi:hypothetical protein
MRPLSKTIQFAIVILLAQTTIVFPQPIFFNDSPAPSIALELQKPNYDEDLDISGLGFFVNLHARLSNRTKLLVEFPYFHYEENTPFGDFSQSSIGNIFVGIKTGGLTGDTYFEGGLRLPTADEDNGGALFTGVLSEIPRMEAFIPDYFIMKGLFGYQTPSERGMTGRVKIGPSLWFYTGDIESVDSHELFLHYSAHAWYKSEKVNFGGGLSGIFVFTEDDLSFDGPTEPMIDLGLSFNLDQVEPGLQLRLPLSDDYRDLLDYTISFAVEVEFR